MPAPLLPTRAWFRRFRLCWTPASRRFASTRPRRCAGSTATRPQAALWPHLDEEADLARKLELIAFLGRHGFRDGYSQAIEHLSQINLRDQAVEAFGAVADPRAVPELRRIWQTSNDLAWNAAVIRALARLGQADITPKLLDLARVPGDPLAPSALVGLGYLASPEALPIVQEAIGSRSEERVIAATGAAAKLLARPELKSEPIRDRLAALLTDADASPSVPRSRPASARRTQRPALARSPFNRGSRRESRGHTALDRRRARARRAEQSS